MIDARQLETIVDRMGASKGWRTVFDRVVPRFSVLAYHAITDADGLARQLDVISTDFRALSLADAIAELAAESPDGRGVLVTFDDGDRSVLDLAAGLMDERAIPGVAFVVSGVVDTEDPFWWEEVEAYCVALRATQAEQADRVRALKRVPNEERLAQLARLRVAAQGARPLVPRLRGEELRELESMGIDVGNHTASHPCLPMCDAETAEREIRIAHAALTRHLRHPPRAFAYPNGDLDPRVEPILRELGYECGFLFDHRAIRPGADPLRLSRLRVNERVSQDRFRAILNGSHPFVHHLLRRP